MKQATYTLWALRAAAAFAFAWSVFRAARQAVTLDEADTYLWFVHRDSLGFLWYPFPNNHVLNSVLIWISTHLFGLSALTLRLPALAGAALYIGAACFLCRAVSDRFALQLGAFVCLVYNPFIMDFFAAARGYSLANGFLLAALAIPVWHLATGRKSVLRAAASASAGIGLSFCANFAFGFVDAAALLAIAIWAMWRRGAGAPLRVLACCAFPCVAVVLVLCGYPLTHYPRENLWYGAHSFSETAQSLLHATFYRPPFDSRPLQQIERYLPAALAAACVAKLLLSARNSDFRSDPRSRMAAALAGIFALTLAAHYAAFRVARLPLPMTRTAIFFAPLATLLIALAAASPGARVLGRLTAGLLVLLAAHCLLCLRSTYFMEYEWNSDTDQVYRVIDGLNRSYGITEFAADGLYRSSLNFYRVLYKANGFPELAGYPGRPPAGKPVYVLHRNFYRSFIEEQKLQVIFHGKSEAVVAVVPGVLTPAVRRSSR